MGSAAGFRGYQPVLMGHEVCFYKLVDFIHAVSRSGLLSEAGSRSWVISLVSSTLTGTTICISECSPTGPGCHATVYSRENLI
jgi:hypothetical protein